MQLSKGLSAPKRTVSVCRSSSPVTQPRPLVVDCCYCVAVPLRVICSTLGGRILKTSSSISCNYL
uniref:Uncharacterized protein n=1 Tax=Anguilla anguilla TaxID=7936 RepID=A0A0E9VM00_ANGAN